MSLLSQGANKTTRAHIAEISHSYVNMSQEQHRGNRREGRETQTALVSKAEAEAKEKRIEEAKEKQRIEEATAAAATAAAATAASAAAAAIQQVYTLQIKYSDVCLCPLLYAYDRCF